MQKINQPIYFLTWRFINTWLISTRIDLILSNARGDSLERQALSIKQHGFEMFATSTKKTRLVTPCCFVDSTRLVSAPVMARRSEIGDLGSLESTATNTEITTMTAWKDKRYQ